MLTSCHNETFHSTWKDSEVAKNIESSIKYDIPYIEAESYYSYTSVDDFNEPVLSIGCNFATDEEVNNSLDRYYAICDNSGYTMARQTVQQPTTGGYYEFECCFADLVINDGFAIEIQFTIGKVDSNASREQLCILAFTYVPVYDDRWPTNLVSHYLGFDIPHYEFTGAQYSAQVEIDSTYKVPIVTIMIKNADEASESEYYKKLSDLGYVIDDSSYSDGYGYYAFAKDNSHCIEFYYNAYYGLLIFAWSLEGIN